jgi:putative membrane protein
MLIIIINWLVSALAVLIASYLIPGVTVSTFWWALLAALVLGLVNAVIKPILILLTLPINILTLGLFTLVIDAALVLLVSFIVPGFRVAGFWPALFFSIALSIINLLFGLI